MVIGEHELAKDTLSAVERALRTAGDRLSATWDPKEWREDTRFIAAMDLVAMGHARDALKALGDLCAAAPTHLFARLQRFTLALELGELAIVADQAEWALTFHAQHTGEAAAVEAYRSTRLSLPTLDWSEGALLTALRMGEKARDHRVVVDAGGMLISKYPESRALPRALLACADVQLREGRPDFADRTLKSLLARYPLDPLVPYAERRLIEVTGQLAEREQLAARQREERDKLLARQERIERQIERQLRHAQAEQELLEGKAALEEYQRLEQEQFAEMLRVEREQAASEYQRLEHQQALEHQQLAEQQRKQGLVDAEIHALDELMTIDQAIPAAVANEQATPQIESQAQAAPPRDRFHMFPVTLWPMQFKGDSSPA